MPKSHLEELEAITNRLCFRSSEKDHFFEVPSDEANVMGFNLFKNKSVAIIRVFGEKDAYVKFHDHPGVEWFGLYSGSAKIQIKNGETIFLEKGKQVELPSGFGHDCLFLENSWGWAITIPPENFPEE